jgi:hypothetical protein
MTISAIEADLDIFLRGCENSRIIWNGEIAQERCFGKEFECREAMVILSYYSAGLDFVDGRGREEWSEDEDHDCSVEGGGLRLKVYDALSQDCGVDGLDEEGWIVGPGKKIGV